LVWGGLPRRTASTFRSRRPGMMAPPSTSSRSRTYQSTASGQSPVYNAEGYFEPNHYNAYSVNNITAKKGADGSVAVQFGGCESEIPQLPADHEGLELHRAPVSPATEILDRTWKFPEAQPVN